MADNQVDRCEASEGSSVTPDTSPSDTSSTSVKTIRRPLRSAVWKHFRREKGKAQCFLCNKVLAYNGGKTSNLILHLNKVHPSSVLVKKDYNESATTQLSIKQFGKGRLRNCSQPCSVEMQKEITRILTKWTWKDMRPISIVRYDGLKELLSFLVPNYRPPSTTYVSALIRKDFLDGRAVIVAQLQGNMIALTTDIWTSRATQSFAMTTAHYINKEWNLTSCVLETIHFPGHHTGISISEKIQETLGHYNIDVKQISAVVHDEASNAVLAGEQINNLYIFIKVNCMG